MRWRIQFHFGTEVRFLSFVSLQARNEPSPIFEMWLTHMDTHHFLTAIRPMSVPVFHPDSCDPRRGTFTGNILEIFFATSADGKKKNRKRLQEIQRRSIK